MINLDAIESAARAATPGPWHFSRDNWNIYVGPIDADFCVGVYEPDDDADMTGEFIALSDPETVLALCRIARAAVEMMDYGAAMDYPGLRDALRDAGLL